MPLCWRCSGILFGTLALLGWLFTKKRLPALALSVPVALLMPLDVLHAVLTGGDGDNARRFVTGALWGLFGTGAALRIIGHVGGRLRATRGLFAARAAE